MSTTYLDETVEGTLRWSSTHADRHSSSMVSDAVRFATAAGCHVISQVGNYDRVEADNVMVVAGEPARVIVLSVELEAVVGYPVRLELRA